MVSNGKKVCSPQVIFNKKPPKTAQKPKSKIPPKQWENAAQLIDPRISKLKQHSHMALDSHDESNASSSDDYNEDIHEKLFDFRSSPEPPPPTLSSRVWAHLPPATDPPLLIPEAPPLPLLFPDGK